MTHPATQYALDVVDGRILTGKPVLWAARRHLDDLEESEKPDFPFEFDAKAADLFFDFCQLCHHFEGEWDGKPLILEPWQKFIFGSVFGWKRKRDGRRRFRKVWIRIARGNGKTVMVAAVGLYGLVLDGEAGAQIINFANKLEQAEIMFAKAEAMRDASPHLRKRIGQTKNNLHVLETRSHWRPLGNNSKTDDGLSVHFGLGDEIHEHDGGTYHVVESSMSKRRQPLMLSITTAGFDHEGFGGQLDDYYRDVLDPEAGVTNDEAFVYIAELNREDDPWDEAHWIKANPNLDVSVYLDVLRGEAREARDRPSKTNNFLVKHLNFWVAQKKRWLSLEQWDACDRQLDEAALEYERCILGLDLSTNTDMSALCAVFWDLPELDGVAVKTWFWLPEENLAARDKRDRARYQQWADAGLIELTPGNVIDLDFIERRILELATRYEVAEVAYDPYQALQLAIHLQDHGLTVMEVRQDWRLNEPSVHLEALIKSRRLVHGQNPVLRWNAGNVAVKYNGAGEIRPIKDDRNKRIDGIAALVTALARVLHQPKSPARDLLEIHVPPSSRKRDVLELFS